MYNQWGISWSIQTHAIYPSEIRDFLENSPDIGYRNNSALVNRLPIAPGLHLANILGGSGADFAGDISHNAHFMAQRVPDRHNKYAEQRLAGSACPINSFDPVDKPGGGMYLRTDGAGASLCFQ